MPGMTPAEADQYVADRAATLATMTRNDAHARYDELHAAYVASRSPWRLVDKQREAAALRLDRARTAALEAAMAPWVDA